MKKVTLLFTGFLIALLFAISCAQPAPAPAPAPAPNPTPAPAPTPEKTFRWRFNMLQLSMSTTAAKEHVKMAKAVYERSGGRLLIDVYTSGTLGYSPFTVHRALKDGLVEMGETASAYVSEEPTYAVFSQLFLYPDPAAGAKAWDAVLPELQEASAKHNQRILMCYIYTNDNLVSVNKAFPTLESLKGEKIRAWNALVGDWLKAVGAVPVVIPFTEVMTALSTGVVEANWAGPRGTIDNKWFDVAKQYSLWRATLPVYMVLVNLDEWNKLPSDLQDILQDEMNKEQAILRKIMEESEATDLKTLKETHHMNIVEVPPAEIDKARAAAQDLWEAWAKDQGPEAQAALHKVRSVLGY